MNAAQMGSAIPWLRAATSTGSGEVLAFGAGGLQTVSHREGAIHLAAVGRLRLRDAELARLAQTAGMGTALARAFERHGTRLPEQVAGEYALVAWDSARRTGVAAVDRFATYPLFWAERDGRVAFATDPAEVAGLLGFACDAEPAAIHAYLYFHVVPAPLSIVRGVQRLDVGQAMLVERGASRLVAHWTPRFVEDAPFDFASEREAFRAALRAGVEECAAGVPRERLGCFLSGGTDSSTISGLATQAYGAPARTFSIGFDVSGYDERHWSRIAARHFGTDHTEHVMTPEEAEAAIDTIAQAYEQPFGNSSALPTLVCSRIAREAGVSRLLGGDGGDELYGGNERYATQWLFSLYERLPQGVRRGLMEPLLFGPLRDVQLWPVRKARGYVEQARVPLPERLGSKYNLLNRFGAASVLTPAVLDGCAGFEPTALEREVWSRCDARAQINRLLAYDFKFTLGDSDLPKVTRMCHAAGAEIAFPMLADAIVDHSLRLAPGQKLRRTRLRHFFKEALRGFLPDEIIEKPKHGFGMPFGDWVLSQPRLAARARDALASLAERGLVQPAFLGQVGEALRSGHAGYFGTMFWVLMILELWLRAHPGCDVSWARRDR
jgi:asparagine synthase (glutamine-hydrolysing)